MNMHLSVVCGSVVTKAILLTQSKMQVNPIVMCYLLVYRGWKKTNLKRETLPLLER